MLAASAENVLFRIVSLIVRGIVDYPFWAATGSENALFGIVLPIAGGIVDYPFWLAASAENVVLRIVSLIARGSLTTLFGPPQVLKMHCFVLCYLLRGDR